MNTYSMLVAFFLGFVLWAPVRGQENKDSVRTKTFAAVTVNGQHAVFDVKPDRTIIHVAGAIAFSGSTVLDVLQHTPGVSVDRQGGAIGMNGKTGVVLMINGKIMRIPMDAAIQLLSGTPSASVEKIELITVPPAGLDAEGNAGFVNIVMKKDTRFGTNGSLTLGGGYSNGGQGSSSLDLNHRTEKCNVFGNLSLSDIRENGDLDFYHATTDNGVMTVVRTAAPRSYYIANGSGQAGFDWQVDRRTVVGGLVSGYGLANLAGIRSYNTGSYSSGGSVDSVTHLFDHEIHNTYNLNANLNLEHQSGAQAGWVANLDYLHWLDDNPVAYRDSTFAATGKEGYGQIQNSHKRTLIHTWVAQADYHWQWSKAVAAQAGLKGTLSQFTNAVDVDSLSGGSWQREAAFSATSALREAYPAAYASVKAQLSAATTFDGGLRYEYTITRLTADSTALVLHRQYGDWFPTATLSHRINAANAFDVSVNRRISRPTFNDMAPWVLWVDAYTYFTGNPGLLPAIANNANLHYRYRTADLTIGYSDERHSIADFFPIVDSVTHVETLSAVNLRYTRTFSASLSLPVRVTSWWRMSWTVDADWHGLKAPYPAGGSGQGGSGSGASGSGQGASGQGGSGSGQGASGQGVSGQGGASGAGGSLEVARWSVKLTGSQDFTLPAGFSASLSGYYQSPGFEGFFVVSAYGSLDLAVRKDFGSGGKLTFNATNVLNTMAETYSVDQPASNLVAKANLMLEYPMLRVTYTRSFGNGGVKEHRERVTGAEDERSRVR